MHWIQTSLLWLSDSTTASLLQERGPAAWPSSLSVGAVSMAILILRVKDNRQSMILMKHPPIVLLIISVIECSAIHTWLQPWRDSAASISPSPSCSVALSFSLSLCKCRISHWKSMLGYQIHTNGFCFCVVLLIKSYWGAGTDLLSGELIKCTMASYFWTTVCCIELLINFLFRMTWLESHSHTGQGEEKKKRSNQFWFGM